MMSEEKDATSPVPATVSPQQIVYVASSPSRPPTHYRHHHFQQQQQRPSTHETKREALTVLHVYLTMWVVLEVTTIAFLMAYFILPSFAFLRTSNSCNVINPATGQLQSEFYLQMYSGFSSVSGGFCSSDSSSFCLGWDNAEAWQRFVEASTSANSFSDTTSTLSSAQALVPCSFFFLLVSFSIHLYLAFKPAGSGPTKSWWVYWLGTWAIIISWILVLTAQSEILYAPPFIPSLWASFFRQGYTLDFLLDPTAPKSPSPSSCSVALGLMGGVWLSVSVGLLFFLTWFSLIAGCCLYPLLEAASADVSASA